MYTEYFDGIVADMTRTTGNCEDAKELTQEVFIKYYQAIWAGTDIQNVESWLRKTARYVALNFKRLYRNRNVSYESEMEIMEQSAMEQNLEIDELRMICGEIIRNELHSPSDAVFFMKVILNYRNIEVARILSLRKEQVSYYYRTSCRKMRAGLQKRGITLEEVR